MGMSPRTATAEKATVSGVRNRVIARLLPGARARPRVGPAIVAPHMSEPSSRADSEPLRFLGPWALWALGLLTRPDTVPTAQRRSRPRPRAPSPRVPSPQSPIPRAPSPSCYHPPMTIEPEVWLRGPVEGVPAELLPAAHAFLQTLEDVEHAAAGLTQDQLWRTPGGAPSVGFHLLHLDGSTDRLLTYARGERLSADQKAALAAEQAPSPLDATSAAWRRSGSRIDGDPCGAAARAGRDGFTKAHGGPRGLADDGDRAAVPCCRAFAAARRTGGHDREDRPRPRRRARACRSRSKAELDFTPATCRIMSHAAARSARRNRSRSSPRR